MVLDVELEQKRNAWHRHDREPAPAPSASQQQGPFIDQLRSRDIGYRSRKAEVDASNDHTTMAEPRVWELSALKDPLCCRSPHLEQPNNPLFGHFIGTEADREQQSEFDGGERAPRHHTPTVPPLPQPALPQPAVLLPAADCTPSGSVPPMPCAPLLADPPRAHTTQCGPGARTGTAATNTWITPHTLFVHWMPPPTVQRVYIYIPPVLQRPRVKQA